MARKLITILFVVLLPVMTASAQPSGGIVTTFEMSFFGQRTFHVQGTPGNSVYVEISSPADSVFIIIPSSEVGGFIDRLNVLKSAFSDWDACECAVDIDYMSQEAPVQFDVVRLTGKSGNGQWWGASISHVVPQFLLLGGQKPLISIYCSPRQGSTQCNGIPVYFVLRNIEEIDGLISAITTISQHNELINNNIQ